MKNSNSVSKEYRISLVVVGKILLAVMLAMAWISCKEVALKNSAPEQQHDARLQKPDGTAIYIDAVPNSTVMKDSGNDTASSRFYSFRIGFADSMIIDKKQEMEKQRYYDFEMQKDWMVLINGDSIRPVFFHPQVQKTTVLKEFIMVFEVPSAWKPDTFIYKDRNRREINTIVLNRK